MAPSAAFFAYAAEHGGTGGPEGSVALAGGATADVLLPDFAFWAEGVDMGRYPLNPPTLAIEVRSPSQSLASQREKCETYVRRGVSEAWLIDPESQSVETVVSGGAWAAYRDADSIVPAVSLPGFSIRLSDVFG